MLFAVIKCVHILALLLLFSASVIKNLLVRPRVVSRQYVEWCRLADITSGAAAGLIVLSGIGLLYTSSKTPFFYTGNTLFWVKIGLLVATSLLIVRTKLFFRSTLKTKSEALVDLPKPIRNILMFDLISLAAMAFLGLSIASGLYV